METDEGFWNLDHIQVTPRVEVKIDLNKLTAIQQLIIRKIREWSLEIDSDLVRRNMCPEIEQAYKESDTWIIANKKEIAGWEKHWKEGLQRQLDT